MEFSGRNHPAIRMPARRRLRAFAFDPMTTRLSGRYLTVDIAYDTALTPGPEGALVQVVDYDPQRGVWYYPVDLDDPAILAQDGLLPSERDPRTHQQVVYAVTVSVIERFEQFIGRRFRWRANSRLRLVPHAFDGRNAYFDPERRAVLFGYYEAEIADPGANLPGQLMFTCLSVDIVAHEVTHALVHRLRKYFTESTNIDVFAWHEACADLIALFNHFSYPEIVSAAVAGSQGELKTGSALLDLAEEFGRSTGRGAALRSAIGSDPTPEAFLAATEPHTRGACFVAAVFDAYFETYREQISDLQRLATGGTGVLPPGALPPDLVGRVTAEAIKNAERLLSMVIRSFDYLPVVDVTFGDVVRAIITADRRLYPDDTSHLRATLVEALRRRGIFPAGIASLADETVSWAPPPIPLNLNDPRGSKALPIMILNSAQGLDLAGTAAVSDDLNGLGNDAARALHKWAETFALELGLDPKLKIELVGSHVAFLQAADRQTKPLVAIQFAQRHPELEDQHVVEAKRVPVRSGTTVVARVDGQVEHVIAKPLPLSDPTVLHGLEPELLEAALAFHEAGQVRWTQLQAWTTEITDADALAAWVSEPAALRLTFANLHAAETARN